MGEIIKSKCGINNEKLLNDDLSSALIEFGISEMMEQKVCKKKLCLFHVF